MTVSPSKPQIVFREIPMLVEIEQWIESVRGIMWRPEFEARVDEVSVALFGINRAATQPNEPRREDFSETSAFFDAHDKWASFRAEFQIPGNSARWYDDVAFLEDLGIDIWHEDERELRCAEWFTDQAIAASKQIGGAAFTPDGSGNVASADAESWGAAMQRAARDFTRKK